MGKEQTDELKKQSVNLELKGGRKVKLELPSIAEILGDTVGHPLPLEGSKITISGEKGRVAVNEFEVTELKIMMSWASKSRRRRAPKKGKLTVHW
jgi:hypothetical protein